MANGVNDVKEPRATPGVRMLTVLALLAIGTLPLLPAALFGRYPRTHEGMRYETLATFFQQAMTHGFLYPRWLPELAGGLGYPTFVFYQPGFFFLTSLWMSLLDIGAVAAVQLSALAYAIAGSGGAYLLARQFAGRGVAIACAALFMVTPYAFVNLYVRGDHSEFAAMMLTPWPIACFLFAEPRPARASGPPLAALIVAAVSLAGIVATHPAVAMTFVPLALALAALRTIAVEPSQRLRWLATVGLVAITAAALSSPYWWFVWRNAPFVRLDRVAKGLFDPLEHTVEPWRLISSFWDFGPSPARITGRPVGMSFQLGLPHLLLAAAGAWLGRRRPWVLAVALCYMVIALLMTTLATPLWGHGSPLRILQFPWRLLAVLAPLQLLLAAAGFSSLRLTPRKASIVATASVLLAAGYYHAMFQPSTKPFQMADGSARHITWGHAQQIVNSGVAAVADVPEVFAGMNEFDPIWLRAQPPFRKRGPMIDAPGSRVYFTASNTSHRVDARVESVGPTEVTIQQFYFPGWRVEVDGQPLPDDQLRAHVLRDGRMRVPVPAGNVSIVAYFDGPLGWRGQLAGAVSVSLAGVAGLFWIGRRTPNGAARPD